MSPAEGQSQSQKRKISGSAFARDVKAGVSTAMLMETYGLTLDQLAAMKRKLVERGFLPSEFLPQFWYCPKCDFPHSDVPLECKRCGLVAAKAHREDSSARTETHGPDFTTRPADDKASSSSEKTGPSPHWPRQLAQEGRMAGTTDGLPWLFVGITTISMFGTWSMSMMPSSMGIGALLQMSFWVAGRAILYHDREKLKSLGYDTRNLNVWWLILSTIYLARRARLTRGSYGPFVIDLFYLLLIVLASLAVAGMVLAFLARM